MPALIARDPWARSLGIEFLAIAPGRCRAALTLTRRMLNFQGAPHGGVVFSLADMVFGMACNAHGEAAVALTVTIQYLAAVAPGSRLVAEAREVKLGRRAAFYDVTVTADDGRPVALAHCVAQRLGMPLSELRTRGIPGAPRPPRSSGGAPRPAAAPRRAPRRT